MGNSITLMPVKKIGADKRSLTGSLQQHGMNRMPGCMVTIPPYREIDGSYRTGMDENALYIKKWAANPAKAEQVEAEKARVKAKREKLEAITGLDLGPHSNYFKNMGKSNKDDTSVGQFARLPDDTIVFDFDDPQREIMAAWLQVHPLVAPSYEDYRRGLAGNQVMYYVSNPEAEAKMTYDEKKNVNRAIVELDKMTPPNMRRIARLLDLPVSEDTPEQNVYNQLDNFIKQGEVKQQGVYKGRRAVSVFNEIFDMKEELLAVKDLIKLSFQHSIYRKTKGVVFEGETRISDSEQELAKELIVDTAARISLEKKVKSKQKLNS